MMRVKSNQQHVQQHQHTRMASPVDTDVIQRNFTFLPMLCTSSSTKQVRASHRRCASSSSTTSSTITEDPSSPKVGCMGQVKRNNKVVGFPSFTSSTTGNSSNSNNSSGSSTRTATSTTAHQHVRKCHKPNNYTNNSIIKYHKLKRFFLAKSPTSVITTFTKGISSGTHKGKIGRKNVGKIVCKAKSCDSAINSNFSESHKGSLVNIVDMDPPLPVVKKIVQNNNDGENNRSRLWNRRFGGAPLESLRVQVIHQNNISVIPANTV